MSSRRSASARAPRAGPSRSRWPTRSTRSRLRRETSPTPWATSSRPPARWATSSWRSTPRTGLRGRLVIEAKDSRLSQPRAMKELNDALAERSADFALLVVPTEEELPAKVEPLRERNGDEIVVALDPETGTLALELAYRLARAQRVLMKRSDADGIDAGALRASVERAVAALGEERKVKNPLTGAKTGIDKAYELVEAMAAQVRAQLEEIDALVRAGCDDGVDGDPAARPPRPAGARGASPMRRTSSRSRRGGSGSIRSLFEAGRSAPMSSGRCDLIAHRRLQAGAHLVAAGRQRPLEGRGVAGIDQARLLDERRPRGDRARPPRLVRDGDDDRAGAGLRGRQGDLVALDDAAHADRDRRPRVVPEVLVAAARHEDRRDRDSRQRSCPPRPHDENLPNQTDRRASRRSSSSSWMRVRTRSESRCTSATSSASSGRSATCRPAPGSGS